MVDEGAVQNVVAAGLRLLREGALALEALDAQFSHEGVFMQQRGDVFGVFLIVVERHPVEAVMGPQIEPFVEPAIVQHAGFFIDEVDQVFAGGSLHHAFPSIVIVMYFSHAWNWLRIWRSVVPFSTAISSKFSPSW